MSQRCTVRSPWHLKTEIIIASCGDKRGDPITNYGMTRVTFGIASASFLATNSVLRVAEENELEIPLAAKTVFSRNCGSEAQPGTNPSHRTFKEIG